MPSRKFLNIFAVALLVCQLANLAFWHPTHFDFVFASGQGRARIITHDDADHCKHLPLEDHSQCAICDSAHNRVSIEPTREVKLGFLQLVGRYVVERPAVSQRSPLADSFYRRGPPSFPG